MVRKSLISILFCLLFTIHTPAEVRRQMRGAWIATVENIDWPSAPGLSDYQSRQEMLLLLDSLKSLHFNTVIVQIRPTADAFYYSLLEPASHWLTGTQGLMPNYDPLSFIISEAHKRCIEVHAWLNPFRASNTSMTFAQSHIYNSHPDWFVNYAGRTYFNPAMPETRSWLCSVVADIVRRYDIDAIHMDDYFYPYPVKGAEFPDQTQYEKYAIAGQSRDDFRRDCVTAVIRDIAMTIRSIKPHVQFGISPFGIWRNKTSDPHGSDTKGLQNYDDLYADILLWCNMGLIDYVTPQLYWEIGHKVADYATLSRWWHDNVKRGNLYAGLYASQLGKSKANAQWRNGNELCRQMTYSNKRGHNEGYMLYSLRPMLNNPQGLLDSLRNNYFNDIAIPPVTHKIPTAVAPHAPQYLSYDNSLLTWVDYPELRAENKVIYFIIYRYDTPIAVTSDNYYRLSDPTGISVSAVSRMHIESQRTAL